MRYVIAVAVSALAVLLRWPLHPLLGDRVPFITLFAAIPFIAWYCGRGPALLALAVGGAAAAYFLLMPRYSFAVGHLEYQVGLIIYVAIGLASIAMFESLRQSQQVAAEQGERLRTTLASIGDAVIATDSEGRITTMNAVAESLTGWKSAEAVGQALDAVFRIVNEQTRQPAENPVQKVLKLGRVVGLANHTALIAKGGTERPIDDSAAPIRSKDGRIVGCVLVFRDVTERRRQETALREQAEQLRDEREWLRVTLASIGDAVITTDTGGHITFLNTVAESLTGWTQTDAVGQPLDAVFRIVNEQSRRPVENPVTRALRDGVTVGLTNHTVLIRKDAAELSIDDSASPIKDVQGQVLGCVLIFRDITERRRAEAEERDSEQRMRSVVNTVVDGIIAITENGTVETVNPAAERLFGYTSAEVVGQNVKLLMPEPYRSEHDTYVANYTRTGEAKIIGIGREVMGRRKDGSTFPMDLAVSEFTLGGRRYFTGIVRDISERRRSEEALKEADRRKNEFLATLAHELRNPLAPIRNAVQILLVKGPPEPDLIWGREVINRQVQHMARLLDDLLDVSRITHNKLELRKERVELAAVVQSAIETSRPLIDGDGHELTVVLPPEPFCLEADPVRLAQVFSNLLNNAAKYSPPGGHIRITGERQGSDVVVSVKDDGMGVAAEMLPRIFDTFSQARRVLERSRGGLGIGLSLVRGLVELHGGSVEARSAGSDQGSEFIVRLPLVVGEVVKEATPPGKGRQARAGNRLLIVDDLKDSADSLAMLLRMMGHEVHTAYDGEDAIVAAEKFTPEVALLDIGMPKLNGYDACRRIRQQPWGKDMYLVALTGWGQEEDRRRTEEAGFDHHMVKPVDPDEVMKLLASRSTEAPGQVTKR